MIIIKSHQNTSKLTGIIQLAKSPYFDTCMAPSMVRLMWPLKTMTWHEKTAVNSRTSVASAQVSNVKEKKKKNIFVDKRYFHKQVFILPQYISSPSTTLLQNVGFTCSHASSRMRPLQLICRVVTYPLVWPRAEAKVIEFIAAKCQKGH